MFVELNIFMCTYYKSPNRQNIGTSKHSKHLGS